MADGPIQLQGKWLDDPNVPIHFVNAFNVAPIGNEFILTFACAIPPVVTEGMTPEQLQSLQIPIKPLVRVGMTPDRAVELIQLLQRQLSAYSQTIKS